MSAKNLDSLSQVGGEEGLGAQEEQKKNVLGLSDFEYCLSFVTNSLNSASRSARPSMLLRSRSGLYRDRSSSSVGTTQYVSAGPPTLTPMPLFVVRALPVSLFCLALFQFFSNVFPSPPSVLEPSPPVRVCMCVTHAIITLAQSPQLVGFAMTWDLGVAASSFSFFLVAS
ncbi:hypothetical protein IF1G_08044 [Cordyceps javanica]|uniref:Uncharacterized protein n=1 Tax=Cordyceps javanica TaxID=43265 RepID=A0A545UVI9_9HYPO|nr:hypothetical protein IF1G_08044 [Cordyceps javanica]